MFRPITYKPFYSRFKDEPVHGVHIVISDYEKVMPFEAQLHIMEVIQKLYPEAGLFTDEKAKKSLFDEVLGTDSIRQRILAGDSAEAIIADYQPQVAEFKKLRQQHLIYR